MNHTIFHSASKQSNHAMENHGDEGEAQVAVVMVPLPAQGHLNQLLLLSRIISSHKIPVHYVAPPTHNLQAKLRSSNGSTTSSDLIHFHDFPLPSFENPAPDPYAPTKYPIQLIPLFNSTYHLREPLYALLHQLSRKSKRVIVIHDATIFWVVQDVPTISNAESYCFHSVSAFATYFLYLANKGKPLFVNEKPVHDHLTLESIAPPEMFEFLQRQDECKKCNHGNLFNNSRVIEGQYLNLLTEQKLADTEKHWAIGPFKLMAQPPTNDDVLKRTFNKHLAWLDRKPPKSVLFVSFGTTTSLSDEEIEEIAVGLERSGQNFVWALREADRADIFVGESRKCRLPEGFEERVQERGIIARDWVPQFKILGHPSTGGFMSHCGWNSCTESISMGVPIAAWPMHSDQPLNAILISDLLRVGFVVREWQSRHEIVRSETVEESVRRLMASGEGDELRCRAGELSTAIKQSVEENGAAAAELRSFISHITRD